MIDRAARNNLAESLRHFVSGQITNDEFMERGSNSKDPAVNAVSHMTWQFYDDLKEHYLKGEYRIPDEHRKDIARWILFLYSDQKYEWPKYRFIQIYNWPMNLLTLGWWERRKEDNFKKFMASGEYEYWPFMSEVEYKKSLNNPKLFKNTKSSI